MKIGDRVRFLNSIGGGVVVGFQSKDIVLVRDDDDFDVPTHVRDVVVVEPTNQYNFPTEEPQKVDAQTDFDAEEPEKEIELPAYSFNERNETAEGEALSIYLAFVPHNVKQLQTSDIDIYLVNDSNYYLNYNLLRLNSEAEIYNSDCIEPQTKLIVSTIESTEINDFEKLRFQALAFKKHAFDPKPAIDVELKIEPVKLCKLHSYIENDYFETPAMLVPIIENDVYQFDMPIDANALQRAIQQKEHRHEKRRIFRSSKPKNEPIEIDLHINALLDTTAGMSSGDMLQYQLNKFNQVMRENLQHHGQKLIFIHGKGDGVLRMNIEKELRAKYRTCRFQDASFQKYGFGATQVTIY